MESAATSTREAKRLSQIRIASHIVKEFTSSNLWEIGVRESIKEERYNCGIHINLCENLHHFDKDTILLLCKDEINDNIRLVFNDVHVLGVEYSEPRKCFYVFLDWEENKKWNSSILDVAAYDTCLLL